MRSLRYGEHVYRAADAYGCNGLAPRASPAPDIGRDIQPPAHNRHQRAESCDSPRRSCHWRAHCARRPISMLLKNSPVQNSAASAAMDGCDDEAIA